MEILVRAREAGPVWTARSASLAAIAVLTACQAPPGASGTTVGFADFPSEAARADCRLLFACCTPAEIGGIWAPGVTTEAECIASYESYLRSEALALQPHLDLGRLSWDASAAGDCIAAIDAARCPDLFGASDVLAGVLVQPTGRSASSVPACGRRLVGHVALAAQCDFDAECTSGLCPDDTVGPRACTALPAEGETCTTRCRDGLYCDSRIADPRCRVPGPDGSACTPGLDEACAGGSTCNGGTCGPRPPLTRCGVML